jgi:hypothetical protein
MRRAPVSSGPPYLVVVGVAVGSLLTALLVPLVFGESLRGGTDVATGGFSLTPRAEADGEATGTTAVAADPASGAAPRPGAAPATGAGPATNAGSAGPGTGSAGGPGPGLGNPVPEGAVLTASDVGVTAEEIRIGFLLLDVGGISQVGISVPGVDPEQQRATFEAYLAEVNERGGINGRRVVGVYENFDVLSPDDMRRACLALIDQDVFAVVAAGGYQGPAVLCITEEGGTPLVTQGSHGTPTEYLRRSDGRLVTMYPSSVRVMANWVAELDRMGLLEGRRIGIVTQETVNPGDTVIGGELVPALREFGYEPTHISNLSGDASTAASQVPVEVQQMRTKDVDLVFMAAGTLIASQFVQAADSQVFTPQYTITDWASMNNDTGNQNMPLSYDGTVLITTYRTGEEKVGVAEGAAELQCREIYERRTGRTLPAKGQNEHGITVTNCTTINAFFLGATNAGPDLTRESFSEGVQAIGEFPMTLWGGGAFGPGKFDAADLIASAQWYADCRCLKPTSGFRPSVY